MSCKSNREEALDGFIERTRGPVRRRIQSNPSGRPSGTAAKEGSMNDMTNGNQERRSKIVLDLFERYYDRAYAFARKSADPAVAEDAAQEAFVRLLQHPRLEELDISISYVLKVVHNILRRRHTRSARLREILDQEVAPRQRSREESDSLGFETGRTAAVADLRSVERSFARLTDDERDALRMIVCEGRSYSEAARSLGASVTAINNWKHRGLRKLRKHLAAEDLLGSTRNEPRHARTG